MEVEFEINSLNKMQELCRTCLTKNKDMLSIFQCCENNSINIHEMIMAFCSVQITKESGHPVKICLSCLHEAKNAYLFKQKCEDSDRTFKEHLTLYEYDEHVANEVKEESKVCTFSDSDQQTIKNEDDHQYEDSHLENVECNLLKNSFVISDLNGVDLSNLKHEDADHINAAIFNKNNDISFEDRDFDDQLKIISKKLKRLGKKSDSTLKRRKTKLSVHLSTNRTSKKIGKLKSNTHESQLRSCQHCEFTTKLPSQLKIHMHIHTGEKPLGCDLCNFRCIQSSSLQNHRLTHTNEKPYECSYCEYKCTNSSNLKRHMRKHTNDKPYFCDLCSYRCAQSSHLKEHRRVHTGEKPFLCDQCHFTCGSISNLKTHKRNKHTIEKKYSCDECSFKAKTKSTLVAHKKRHSGDRKYACEFCTYKSIQLATLENHKRMVHTHERPYACDQCSYRCVSSAYLKSHQRTHMSMKMFSCDECGYTCHTNFKLKSHKMTHTGEKPYQCTICDFKCAQSFSLRRHHKRNHAVLSK